MVVCSYSFLSTSFMLILKYIKGDLYSITLILLFIQVIYSKYETGKIRFMLFQGN